MKIANYLSCLLLLSGVGFTLLCDADCHVPKFKGIPNITRTRATNLSRLPPNLACLRLSDPALLNGVTWYRNDEFDPWLAINPTNHHNMILVAQQDALFQSIPLAVIALYTIDGGRSWNESNLVLSRCQGATLEGANDDFQSAFFPSVTFAPDGSAYLISSSFSDIGESDEGNIIAKSTDGGASWTRVTAASRDDRTTHFYDSPRITADPFRDRTVYFVTSDDLCNVGGSHNLLSFFRTTDGGNTWNGPITISQTAGCSSFFFFSELNVLPDDPKSLFVTAMMENNVVDSTIGEPDQLMAWRSEDGGNIWHETIIQENIEHILPTDPTTGLPLMILPTQDMAVNLCNGHIYVVFSTPEFNPTGQAGVAITMSEDNGKTWSIPRPVNPESLSAQAFLPSVAVAEDGTVGVLFYDTRNFSPDSTILNTDVWVSFLSKNLEKHKGEVRLTLESFDSRQAIFGFYNDEHYISSYVRLLPHHNDDFVAAFTVVGSDCSQLPMPGENVQQGPTLDDCNRQDIVFAHIKRH